MNKCRLREHIKDIIARISVVSRKEQSELLFQKIIRHERYKAANKLSIYLSTENEVDTRRILQYTLEVAKKQCYIPFVRKKKSQCANTAATRMVMVRLSSLEEFEKLPLNHYGIKEPIDILDDEDKVAKPSESGLELIIVPGLAFSQNGRRIGHGKGYYDEFLTDWQAKAVKPIYSIGLAFKEQILDDVPIVEGHDFILDEVLVI